MITVVGMGRNSGDLTMQGMDAIKQADVVVVKSQLTHCAQTVAQIRSDAIYCDDLFQIADDFDSLNNAIASRLQSFGKRKVAFCVVGNGSDDSTVQTLANCKVVPGVSLCATVVGNNLLAGTVSYTAADLIAAKRVLPMPTVVTCVDDKYVAAEVQLKLLGAFEPTDKVVFSTSGASVKVISLMELTRQRFTYQTVLYVVPQQLVDRNVFAYYDCSDIMSVLRSENGCAWDRAQTHKSIVKNVIEEAYELASALEKEDVANVIEELGDLLMQVIFHIEIAKDMGEFDEAEVYTALCRKLIDRHPHVFGNVKTDTADQALDVWDKQKQKEHKINNVAQNVLDVPQGMSALMRGQKIQQRAAKGGYEFQNAGQIVGKVREELDEFLSADEQNRPMEGGDLLFAVVNLLRLYKVDAETALLLSTQKFVDRVVECERLLAERNQKLVQLNGQQFDELWAEAKRNG